MISYHEIIYTALWPPISFTTRILNQLKLVMIIPIFDSKFVTYEDD